MTIPLWLRKVIRPLVPDRVMARYRLAEHSRQVRTNIDVMVSSGRQERRWLATTPDTYRARISSSYPEPVVALLSADEATSGADGIVVVGAGHDDPRLDGLLRPLGDPEIAASVWGRAAPPRLADRRRTEPKVAPEAIAIRAAAYAEVAGGEPDVTDMWHRLRDAGHRLALIPQGGGGTYARTSAITSPAAVILAAVPAQDVGGGSRGIQLAHALIRRGFHVTYAPLFGGAESTDLGIRFVHHRLEQPRVAEFEVAEYVARLRTPTALAIVELPARALLEPVEQLSRAGVTVAYDLIDNWRTDALGGRWYDEKVEQRMVDLADLSFATAPDLVTRIEELGAAATLIPNGVNAELFGGLAGPVPVDFPPGDGPVFGYQGSLYGDWFDWSALAGIGESFPRARVLVIGDPPQKHPPLPDNVHLLGLKPQRDLPAYVSRFDVGLVPWLANEVTHAVHPLKTYEYLGCGVPVAAPPLRAMEGIPGVYMSHDLVRAVERALEAPAPDRTWALREHSWDARLASILEAAGLEVPPIGTESPRVVLRPPVHYAKADRRT